MVRHGLSDAEASANFWVVDHLGLITKDRENLHQSLESYARVPSENLPEGTGIEETVRQVGVKKGNYQLSSIFQLIIILTFYAGIEWFF